MAKAAKGPVEARGIGSRGSKAAAHVAAPARLPLFNRSLPMLLLWAREATMQRFRAHMHALGLTDQQWRIIRALADAGSCDICELSARCCIHPASLSRTLPRLAADGLVSRIPNARDQRRVIVSLTPQGRRLFERAISAFSKVYANVAKDVGAERIEHLAQALEDLIRVLGMPNPNSRPHGSADAAPDPSE
jgi:homoprotocatechuate degradation regulator HpaR